MWEGWFRSTFLMHYVDFWKILFGWNNDFHLFTITIYQYDHMKCVRDGLINVFGRGLCWFSQNPFLVEVMVFIYSFLEGVNIFTGIIEYQYGTTCQISMVWMYFYQTVPYWSAIILNIYISRTVWYDLIKSTPYHTIRIW